MKKKSENRDQLKSFAILYDLTYMWNLNKNQKHQAHRYREQIGGCQRQGVGVGEMGEGRQKVQTFSYKISHGDVIYSMVTIVNNTVSYI